MAMSLTQRNHTVRLMMKPWSLAMLALIASQAIALESANAACGEVAIAKGDLKVENVKTKKSVAAVKGTKVCQGDAIVAGPMARAKIVMEDGNELNISPDSRIVLEQYEYKPADNKKKVMLNVLYGKVRAATKEENMYGDKAADGQANAFQVKTKSAVAGVRGTDFLTSFDRMSNKSEVVTFRGKVDVGTPGANGAILNPVSVGAGQKTEALPGAPPAPPKPVPAREMEKMNVDTKADVAGGSKDSGNQSPTNKDAAKDNSGDKKDDGKKEPTGNSNGNANADNGKEPAAGQSQDGGGKDDKGGKSNNGNNGNGRGGNGGPNSGSGDDKKGPVAGNQPSPGQQGGATRSPSSAPGGSMINAGDLGKAPGQSPVLPTMPMVPVYGPPVIGTVPVVAPVCDLCNRAIESGPGQVKITITIPN